MQLTCSVSLAIHVLKLGVLVAAASGCVATYSLAILWICLNKLLARLLLVTALLLRQCMEVPFVQAETSNTQLEAVEPKPASEEYD